MLSAVGHENVAILLRLCLRHFDRKMVSSKPLAITGVQGELLTSYVHVIRMKVKERSVFCVWEPNCKLAQLRSLSSPAIPERHHFPSSLHALTQCPVVLSILSQSFQPKLRYGSAGQCSSIASIFCLHATQQRVM